MTNAVARGSEKSDRINYNELNLIIKNDKGRSFTDSNIKIENKLRISVDSGQESPEESQNSQASQDFPKEGVPKYLYSLLKRQDYNKMVKGIKVRKSLRDIPPSELVMNFSVWEIILKTVFCCCPAKTMQVKNELLKKGEEKFLQHMDILSYVRKMQELDLLKYLLLNQEQITLLNFLSKPSVSLINRKDIFQTISQKSNIDINFEEIDKIHSAFNKIFDNKIKSAIDTRLIDVVSYEIDSLISE